MKCGKMNHLYMRKKIIYLLLVHLDFIENVLGIYNSFILKLIDTIYRIQDLRIKEKPLPENLLLYIENKFNYYLEELCNEFPNTNFINLAFYNITCGKLDFYPSREGNISIGKIITKKIYKKIRKFLKRKI